MVSVLPPRLVLNREGDIPQFCPAFSVSHIGIRVLVERVHTISLHREAGLRSPLAGLTGFEPATSSLRLSDSPLADHQTTSSRYISAVAGNLPLSVTVTTDSGSITFVALVNHRTTAVTIWTGYNPFRIPAIGIVSRTTNVMS